MKKNLSSNTYLFFTLVFFIVAVIVAVIVYIFYSWFTPRIYYYNDMQFKEYSANSPYADVTFRGNDEVMYVTVKYKDLKGVSAIHIHVNNNGSPGPILAWLGTTNEWQNGVAQTATNANSPCSTKSNPNGVLASPDNIGTPYINELNRKFRKNICNLQ